MERTITYHGSNLVAYTESGDLRGYPVLVQHGMIASIRDLALFDRLGGMGTRLICMARPGYGRSSAHAMRDIAAWGEIVAHLVDALGLASFDVLGVSSGAPYSYAIGHALPDRVRSIFILSGTPALYDAEVQAAWPYPIMPEATLPELQALARELFFPHPSEADLQRNDVADSMAHDCFGIAQDLRLRCRDWGFRLSDLRARIVMQHSRLDDQVPFVTAELTSRLLPDCRFIAAESGEHFSREVLDGFIEDALLGHLGRSGTAGAGRA